MEQFYTIRQVVHFAITLEQASQHFYRHLAQHTDVLPVKLYLQKLADEEALHEEALKKAIENSPDALSSVTISKSEVAAYIEAVKVPDPLDYKGAVRLARDKENASRMLYSILAGIAENPILENLFLYLVQQETEHKEYFETEYSRITLGQN